MPLEYIHTEPKQKTKTETSKQHKQQQRPSLRSVVRQAWDLPAQAALTRENPDFTPTVVLRTLWES